MKTLQSFVNENLEYHIYEGEIWDAIKEWFKKLFEPSDRDFDRYNPDIKISGDNLNNYQKYLDDNFDIKNINIKPIPIKTLKKVVYPNNEEPNKDGEIGFYNFIDNVNKEKDNTEYFGFIYEDNKVKDTAALINCVHNSDYIEIFNIQIIKEFISHISIKKSIELLSSNKKFKKDAKKLIIKETSNKELYKQLINDCEFTSDYDKESNTNVASKEI